jgi:hypothetical protein
MRVRILLQITDDAGTSGAAEEITAFEKATERPEDLGLLMAEGKALLAAVQHKIVLAQVAAWSEYHRDCADCGQRRRIKGSYPLTYHTLFGDIELSSQRLHACPCRSTEGPSTVSPLGDPMRRYPPSAFTWKHAGPRSCPMPPPLNCCLRSYRLSPAPMP